MTLKLLLDAIRADGGTRFLVDGFPRNTNNLSGWQQAADWLHVAGVLVYDCTQDVMQERLLERGKTSGRTDDNIESINKRFITFHDETEPVRTCRIHAPPSPPAPPTRGPLGSVCICCNDAYTNSRPRDSLAGSQVLRTPGPRNDYRRDEAG